MKFLKDFRYTSISCFVVLIASCAFAQTAGSANSLAFARAQHLRRGLNLSGWFGQVYVAEGYTKHHFDDTVTVEDLALIRGMGFDHVRLVVNPEPMLNRDHPEQLPTEYLGYLDAAVKMILDHGLTVVIDMHPESDFKARLVKDDGFVERFGDFWRAIAMHYSTWDSERVFFEVLNEPEFGDRYRWLGVQAKLAAAIREGAPKQTIIAAGARWSSDDELLFMEPLHDPNVIYNFHFYEPHIFTHQGATWGEYYWHWLKGLGYPSAPESAQRVAALVPDETQRIRVIRYGQEHWDATRMEAEMKQAAEWARHRGVPLVCNEFGVYRDYSDPADRAAWIRDVRTAFEHNGIGWTMWEYSGGFGVVRKDEGKTVPDEGVLKALGMR